MRASSLVSKSKGRTAAASPSPKPPGAKQPKNEVTPTKETVKYPQDETFENASQFYTKVIEVMPSNTMFKLQIEHFNYYFFSHIQSLQLEVMDVAEVVAHYYDFFVYSLEMFQGKDLGRAYASYYVDSFNPSKNSARR